MAPWQLRAPEIADPHPSDGPSGSFPFKLCFDRRVRYVYICLETYSSILGASFAAATAEMSPNACCQYCRWNGADDDLDDYAGNYGGLLGLPNIRSLSRRRNLAWRQAWSINGTGNTLEFNMTVINHWDRNLTLLKYTYLRLEMDSGSTGNAYPYYIMDPGNSPISPVCYTQTNGSKIVVPYNRTGDFTTGGKPTQVPFMDVTYYKGGGRNVPSNKPQASEYYSVYVVVYYTYDLGGKTYVQAQTIPFEGSGVQ